MQFIDLSREIYHRTPTHPSHPPVILGSWYDHNEIKTAGATRFSSKALHVSMSDHAGTHVDAPCHFNAGSGRAFDRSGAARKLLHRGDLSGSEPCATAA